MRGASGAGAEKNGEALFPAGHHTDGSESLYAHLQYAYVRPGEVVEAGQLLGAAGRSGRATGAHLHFELYRQGTACDPADALGLSS